MLNVDIMISSNEAIEFNGPSHYVQCNGRDVDNGQIKFKRKLLEVAEGNK